MNNLSYNMWVIIQRRLAIQYKNSVESWAQLVEF